MKALHAHLLFVAYTKVNQFLFCIDLKVFILFIFVVNLMVSYVERRCSR